jgi:5-(carboxyamino)imidazole ribonucleotide synthase
MHETDVVTSQIKTIGIIGGGQLGRMLAQAGIPLGFRFVFLDPSIDACARHLGEHICAAYNDTDALNELAQRCDLITFEFENAPAESVAQVSALRPTFPPAKALHVARDRLNEKTLFQQVNIPTPAFANIESQDDLITAVANIGLPAVLKTRTLGYDGKGQKVLRTASDVDGTFAELGNVACLLEGFIQFSGEVSLIAVRSRSGDNAFYPLVHNVHRQGILHRSTPSQNHPLQSLAESYAARVMNELDYVGVMAFEFFEFNDQLIANEIAPRVHNSGHWTIEGAQCSQFENHLRAITDLPLGNTRLCELSVMLNLISQIPAAEQLLAIDGVHLHDYDKAFVAGRKVGHLTCRLADSDALARNVSQIEALIAQ